MPERVSRILVVVLFLATQISFAEDLSQRAQSLLQSALTAKNSVGMTAAISKDGKLVWEGAAGYADRAQGIAAAPGMVHRIASISKPITAVAVMQLVENGKISLDAPIQTYVPEFPKKEHGEILIWQLLSHTSGIRHYRGPEESNTTTHYASTLDALSAFKNDPIKFEPGTDFSYSTYGYTVLCAAIEKASGKSFANYMATQVWGPAGMTSTRLDVAGEKVPKSSKRYRVEDDGIVAEAAPIDNSVRYAGGGIMSTAGDLVRFAVAAQDGTLIKPATFAKMSTPVTLTSGRSTTHALGWDVKNWASLGKVIAHNGGQLGASTRLMICPDHAVAVAVISNTSGNTDLVDIAALLAYAALGVTAPESLVINPETASKPRAAE